MLNPNQDTRFHQANLPGGYSGRSFDTKYITPFLKKMQFASAMKESGWLTRSLEQNVPYDFNFPGKISNKEVKEAFLNILNDIEVFKNEPKPFLLAIFYGSIQQKQSRNIVLINPISSESSYTINQIIDLLNEHFYFKYKSRGASILPVIAIYSIYECITKELKRFENKYLSDLESHHSPDSHSGATGDIVVRNKNDNEVFESVEVKFDIPVDSIMVNDAYNKIKSKSVQRYYVLSTKGFKDEEEKRKTLKLIDEIKLEHGCQFVINGIFPTLKYYLRLIENTDAFLSCYLKNISNSNEINYEHKLAWNTIMKIKSGE